MENEKPRVRTFGLLGDSDRAICGELVEVRKGSNLCRILPDGEERCIVRLANKVEALNDLAKDLLSKTRD